MQNQKRIILNDSQSKLVIAPMVGGALVNYDFKAVSYTHLTLPTRDDV